MKKIFHYIIFLFLALSLSWNSYSQGYFKFSNQVKKQSVNFKLLSNLIVFPIEINGNEFNFILDSGVASTILFNLKSQDSVDLKSIKKIKLQGLGSGEAIDAIASSNNNFNLKNIQGVNQKLYVIFNDDLDLSARLGITVHGIIGYEILKDFIVKVNYGTNKITFYNPKYYNKKDCKKCEFFDLEFHKKKPYINANVKLTTNKLTPVKLLIDSGGSDAMWLFENSHPNIKEPKKYFVDFLGEGLSGSIYGKRAKIKALIFGKYEIDNPTVSYPDSLSVLHARKFQGRNGSMGASILKRFIVTFNYQNKQLGLRRGSKFKEPFRYNMSGIELVHNGKILVKEPDNTTFFLGQKNQNVTDNSVILDYKYKYSFKPSYRIFKVLEGSPGYKAGLMKNDVLIKINGKFVHEMKLEEIIEKFYYKKKRRVSLVVERYGQHHQFKFYLQNILE